MGAINGLEIFILGISKKEIIVRFFVVILISQMTFNPFETKQLKAFVRQEIRTEQGVRSNNSENFQPIGK
jgi:hypothetical protein